MGDLHIDLPNGSKQTAFTFKGAVHSPDLAFTLISVRRLDTAGYTVTFGKGMCQIANKSGHTLATVPHADGLYRIATSKDKDYANVTSSKISINEAHRKLGHISYDAIKNAVSKEYITGIELDAESKPVQKPNRLGSHTRKRAKPERPNMEKGSIGIYGVLHRSKV
jgi:hypothetical protein